MDSEELKKAELDYVLSVYGECVPVETTLKLIEETYGEEIAKEIRRKHES